LTPISVLVVDDSVVVRRIVTSALDEAPDIRVVGTAPNGKVALAKLDQLAPDLVTMDIEMPVLDGISTVRALRRTHPKVPVIMFSTLTEKGASATLEALSAGATDYVTKPANVGSVTESVASIQRELLPKIRALCGRSPAGLRAPAPAAPARAVAVEARARSTPPRKVDLLAVGCSTGGPEALAAVLMGLPAALPVPVVVVQHMPQLFTRLFAERLDRTCALAVCEATSGQALAAGHVYIAPGDFHLEVKRAGTAVTTRLQQGPPENFCRPAVDVLFRSVAQVYGGAALAVVLTGMGADGRRGAEELREKGARVFVQDEATSVVWGMPGAIATAGLADEILPLPAVAKQILAAVAVQRPLAGAGAR
jgi:two-component system chemotaxis response regulator CheB